MPDHLDPIDLLMTRPPGSCLFGRIKFAPDAPWEVAWYVREESRRIAALGHPDIEFRAGALEQRVQGQEVLLLPIVVRIGPERAEHVFEAWLNVFADDGKGFPELQSLNAQDRLTLHFYGDQPMGRRAGGGWAPERSLVVSNQLKGFAGQVLTRLRHRPPWSMQAFDRARAQLEARYPTVMALWQSLQPHPGDPTP
jgi:hypothetical protein